MAPVKIVILCTYFKDKYKKESIKIIARSFFLGTTVSIILTFTIGYIASSLLPIKAAKSISQQFIKAFILVALVAAFSKYVIVK